MKKLPDSGAAPGVKVPQEPVVCPSCGDWIKPTGMGSHKKGRGCQVKTYRRQQEEKGLFPVAEGWGAEISVETKWAVTRGPMSYRAVTRGPMSYVPGRPDFSRMTGGTPGQTIMGVYVPTKIRWAFEALAPGLWGTTGTSSFATALLNRLHDEAWAVEAEATWRLGDFQALVQMVKKM